MAVAENTAVNGHLAKLISILTIYLTQPAAPLRKDREGQGWDKMGLRTDSFMNSLSEGSLGMDLARDLDD